MVGCVIVSVGEFGGQEEYHSDRKFLPSGYLLILLLWGEKEAGCVFPELAAQRRVEDVHLER